jgi:hypothetical protein
MLIPIARNIWHKQHHFSVSGVPISSRMTIIKLTSGQIFLHSPVPLDLAEKESIDALGEVKFIIAPNRFHHLFDGDLAALYPQASLFGVPGLAKKRPDLGKLQILTPAPGHWAPELEYLMFNGIPAANETIWFHTPSGSLIITDLCQWWRGDIGWRAALWNTLVGTRKKLNVPRTIRSLVRDPAAAKASAQQILQWPIQRIILAHNSIIEEDAHAKLRDAFRHFK